jgi:hypothetical protein
MGPLLVSSSLPEGAETAYFSGSSAFFQPFMDIGCLPLYMCKILCT